MGEVDRAQIRSMTEKSAMAKRTINSPASNVHPPVSRINLSSQIALILLSISLP